jgi:SHS2 domain-containing protein
MVRKMDKGYRYISHTADVEFLAYGSTLNGSFRNALLALFDTVSYTRKVSKGSSAVRTLLLKDKAKTVEELLWYTLQDALSTLDMKGLFAYRVSGLKIRKEKAHYTLAAKLYAKRRRDEDSKLDAKGVSRYDLSMERRNGRFVARVVVDV